MNFSVCQKNWVLGYSWSTLLWYWCYYPHRSRAALSPVCGIFFKWVHPDWGPTRPPWTGKSIVCTNFITGNTAPPHFNVRNYKKKAPACLEAFSYIPSSRSSRTLPSTSLLPPPPPPWCSRPGASWTYFSPNIFLTNLWLWAPRLPLQESLRLHCLLQQH